MGARHDSRGNKDRELRAGIRITTSADANGFFRKRKKNFSPLDEAVSRARVL